MAALKNALETTRFESVKKHDIGSRIRLLRGRDSRPAFAGRFGVSVATLARYESSETAPNALFIMQLCEKYGVGTDWLLYGKEAGGPDQGQMKGGETTKPDQEAGWRGLGPERTSPPEPPPGEVWPQTGIKNEAGSANLTSTIKTLDCEDFDRLWLEFKSESEARRGWLQIELIKRFPEFLEWLAGRPSPLRPPPPAALKKDEPPFPYTLPPSPLDD